MIDRAIQRKGTEVNQLHFFDDDNLKSLPFLDAITNLSNGTEFKQPELPKFDNAIGDLVEHLIYF